MLLQIQLCCHKPLSLIFRPGNFMLITLGSEFPLQQNTYYICCGTCDWLWWMTQCIVVFIDLPFCFIWFNLVQWCSLLSYSFFLWNIPMSPNPNIMESTVGLVLSLGFTWQHNFSTHKAIKWIDASIKHNCFAVLSNYNIVLIIIAKNYTLWQHWYQWKHINFDLLAILHRLYCIASCLAIYLFDDIIFLALDCGAYRLICSLNWP